MKAILTIGIPGCGKSTWAAKNPRYTEINLDWCREQVSGDASDQTATQKAVELRDRLIQSAAQLKQDIVLSDTNLHREFRLQLVDQLQKLGFDVEYLVFTVPAPICRERNQNRERVVPDHAMERLASQMTAFMVSPIREVPVYHVIRT